MFSYGSGLTSTMFSLRLHDGQHPFSLMNIASVLDVTTKLESRHVVWSSILTTPSQFANVDLQIEIIIWPCDKAYYDVHLLHTCGMIGHGFGIYFHYGHVAIWWKNWSNAIMQIYCTTKPVTRERKGKGGHYWIGLPQHFFSWGGGGGCY